MHGGGSKVSILFEERMMPRLQGWPGYSYVGEGEMDEDVATTLMGGCRCVLSRTKPGKQTITILVYRAQYWIIYGGYRTSQNSSYF